MQLAWLSITPPTGLSGAHSFPKCHRLEDADGPPQTIWERSAGRQPSHLCAHHQEERNSGPCASGLEVHPRRQLTAGLRVGSG